MGRLRPIRAVQSLKKAEGITLQCLYTSPVEVAGGDAEYVDHDFRDLTLCSLIYSYRALRSNPLPPSSG
jgi:hypothetical protein